MPAMPEPGAPSAGAADVSARLEAALAAVRLDSSAGRVTRLEAIWEGLEEEFRSVLSRHADAADIVVLGEGPGVFLFSDRWMTAPYAAMAARAAGGDVIGLVAEAIRSDSRTYPRPTPAAVFAGPPFDVPAEQLALVLDKVARDPAYADIGRVVASDGSIFYFSSNGMSAVQAASRAEWMAVGRYENP